MAHFMLRIFMEEWGKRGISMGEYAQHRKKERGSSLIGAILLILIFGFAGSSAVQVSTIEKEASSNEMQTEQALYVGQAGIERAERMLDFGLNPVVVNQSFGNGGFTTLTYPASSLVTVSSTVGNASKTQSINADFSKDCVTIDTSGAYTEGANLRNVRLIKSCNTAAIVSKMIVDWNWPSCTAGDSPTEGSEDDYDEYADPDHPDNIFVCHVPPGNPDNESTLSFPVSEWLDGSGHANHPLDYLGPCGEGDGGIGGGDGDGDGAGVDPGTCDDNDHSNDHNHANALVTMIALEGTTIYDPANGIGSPTPFGAESTALIDIVDYTLTTDGTYTYEGPVGGGPEHHILFNTDIVPNGWYKITVQFEDETEIYSIFTL